MRTITGLDRMREVSREARRSSLRIGFVPTMGYLHQGHLTLARKAVEECDRTVLSVFVNPAQFAPGEDLEKYPRDAERDLALASDVGVDVMFMPAPEAMYPEGSITYVDMEGSVTKALCGASRPGHFKGVLTVLAKLFNIVEPDIAYFGQKDLQQSVLVKRMVKDLDIPVEISMLPIVRERSGLAMSSRNDYLSPAEREEKAPRLAQALTGAEELIRRGELRDGGSVRRWVLEELEQSGLDRVEYVEVVDPDSLRPLEELSGACAVLAAVHLGGTRLIDNVLIQQ